MNPELRLSSHADDPTWEPREQEHAARCWDRFMLEDPLASRYWGRLFSDFPDCQFALFEGDRLLAIGNCLPLDPECDTQALPGEGWDWALEKGFLDLEAGRAPRLLCALAVSILPEARGRGLSARMIRAMGEIGVRRGLPALIAPVRPSRKAECPRMPMEAYLRRVTDEGLSVDPWIRVHQRLGGRVLSVCGQSMRIPGSLENWREWTGLPFPPGEEEVLVPGALAPVRVDHARNEALYTEPNVWMLHDLGG